MYETIQRANDVLMRARTASTVLSERVKIQTPNSLNGSVHPATTALQA